MDSSATQSQLRREVIKDGQHALKKLEKLLEKAHGAQEWRLRTSDSHRFSNEIEGIAQRLIDLVHEWVFSLNAVSHNYIRAADESKQLTILRRYSQQALKDFKERIQDRRIFFRPKIPEEGQRIENGVRDNLDYVERAIDGLGKLPHGANTDGHGVDADQVSERCNMILPRISNIKKEVGRQLAAARADGRSNEPIAIGKLNEFWKLIDPIPPKPREIEDVGDGEIFGREKEREASERLSELCDVLQDPTLGLPKSFTKYVDMLTLKQPHIAGICLILKQTGLHESFDRFLERDVCELPVNYDQLSFLENEEILRILSCQYRLRITQREWTNPPRATGPVHHDLLVEEPLPFKRANFDGSEYKYNLIGEGGYASVYRVQNAFEDAPSKLYALKMERLSSKRKGFFNEKERLRKLYEAGNDHIIKLLSSFTRDSTGQGGLILPCADGSLENLLNLYSKKQFFPQSRYAIPTSGKAEEMLLRSLGCLSEGLAFLHSHRVRHNDIKPANILYFMDPRGNSPGRWVWSDFGIAFDFAGQASSKTRSPKSLFFHYGAPELLESVQHHSQHANVKSEDCQLCKGNGQPSLDRGRMADVFSFGIICLEILSVFRGERFKPSHQVRDPNKITSNSSQLVPHMKGQRHVSPAPTGFAALKPWEGRTWDVPSVQEWASRTASHMSENDPWYSFLTCGRSMVQKEPGNRKKMWQILKLLRENQWPYFCDSCEERHRKFHHHSSGGRSTPENLRQEMYFID